VYVLVFELRRTLEISVGHLTLFNRAEGILRFKMEEITRFGGQLQKQIDFILLLRICDLQSTVI
jgi:hypothetical protein